MSKRTTTETIENNFTYHAPFGDQTTRYNSLRNAAKALAQMVTTLTPASREQALALTNLEQAIFWANAAIARNETQPATPTAPVIPQADGDNSPVSPTPASAAV